MVGHRYTFPTHLPRSQAEAAGPGLLGERCLALGDPSSLQRCFLMPASEERPLLPPHGGETQGQGAFPLATSSQGWRLSSGLCPSFAPAGKVLPPVACRSAPSQFSTHVTSSGTFLTRHLLRALRVSAFIRNVLLKLKVPVPLASELCLSWCLPALCGRPTPSLHQPQASVVASTAQECFLYCHTPGAKIGALHTVGA